MRAFLRGLAKACALVLVVLLVVVLPLAITAWDIYRVVFNPPLVKQVLTEIVTQSDLIPVALEWYSERRAAERAVRVGAIPNVDEPDIIQLLSFLDLDAWRRERFEVLPNPMLAGWVSVTVDGVYAWIDSDDRIPQITWHLQPLKDRLNSQHGHNAVQIVYDILKPCNEAQIKDFLARLDAAPVGKEVPYNLCQFPDPWREDQFNDYHDSLLEVVAQVPPTFALTEELVQVEDVVGVGPEAIKLQLRLIRWIGRWAWVAPLILLVLVAMLVVRSWKKLGRWWGIPILIGGVLLVVLRLTYAPLIVWLLARGPLSEVPPLVLHEATQGVLRLGQEIFRPMWLQALITVLIGVLLVALAIVAKEKSSEEAEEEEEEDVASDGDAQVSSV